MRVLYLNEYFWPDNAGRLIRTLAGAWAAAGNEVTVLTMQPHYRTYRGPRKVAGREEIGGLTVRRIPALRLPVPSKVNIAANAILFMFSALVYGLREGRQDVVVGGTMPPIVCQWVAWCLARVMKARYVYHCQDVYPEAEEVLERAMGRPARSGPRAWAYRLMKSVDSWLMRRADAVVVLSEDMRKTVQARGVPADNVAIINNPLMAEELGKAPLPVRARGKAGVSLLFAGNVGRFQGLDLLIRALAALPPEVHAELVIVGDGVAKPELVSLAAELCPSRVRFHDPVPVYEVWRFIDEADYCVVSLLAGIIDVAYPSKVIGYLGRSAPLFCIVEPSSELGRLVTEAGLGVVVPPGAASQLEAALRGVATDREQAGLRAAAAGRAGAALFHPQVIADRWLALLTRLDAKA